MSRVPNLSEKVRPIIAQIRTIPITPKSDKAVPPAAPPFVTISREAGGGARQLAQELVNALNVSDPGERPWTCWDRELVEKVAADCNLSQELIESLEEHRYSWLGDFIGSFSHDNAPLADEARIYGRVAATIRALAHAGRVVIVGMGGIFVTRRMSGGLHVRLVAPFEQRVLYTMQYHHIPHEAAAHRVRQLERNRQAFYGRYWPGESLDPADFHLVLNTALLEVAAMVQIIQTAVRMSVPAPVRT